MRAPAAEAPITADIAANSDSTLRNPAFSSPFFTRAPSASTMWVCGVIGYAQITCGRHMATASATAREPSICLSTGQHPSLGEDVIEGGHGGGGVARGDLAGEPVADRGEQRVQADHAGQRGERAE